MLAFARNVEQDVTDSRPRSAVPQEAARQSTSGLHDHPDGQVPVQAEGRRQRQDPQGHQVCFKDDYFENQVLIESVISVKKEIN